MKRRDRMELGRATRTLTTPGFDWVCGPMKSVTRHNAESFLLLLTRIGVEDMILRTDPTTIQNWRGSGSGYLTDRKVVGKDILWDSSIHDLRVRVRLEFVEEDIPAGMSIEIEKVTSGTRRRYRCESSELVIRGLRRFQDLRRMQELEAAIAASKKGGAE